MIVVFSGFYCNPANFKTSFTREVSHIYNQDSENKRKMDDLTEYFKKTGDESMVASRIARYSLLWTASWASPSSGHLIEKMILV